MIRKFLEADLEEVMDIWLDINIGAHDFITKEYWENNYEIVKSILPKAEVYVYEVEKRIKAFIGIDNGYIAGIFVSNDVQSSGIGKALLGKGKELYEVLTLSVYEKNEKAINFYIREGFEIRRKEKDENTGEMEYMMVWER